MAKKKDPRLTLNSITKAVRALGYRKVELVRGRGYFYWSGGIANRFSEQGVYGIFRLSGMTLKAWVNDFKRRVAEARSRGMLSKYKPPRTIRIVR